MEISMLQMWFFFTLLPNLSCPIGFFMFILGVTILCFATTLILCLYSKTTETREEDAVKADKTLKALLKPFKVIVVIFFILFTIKVSIPTTKQMAAILIVPAITQNQTLQNIGTEMGSTLELYFKEWAQELRNELVETPKKNEEKL